jgi:hypothetical protein
MFDVCVVLGSAFLAIRTIHTVSAAPAILRCLSPLATPAIPRLETPPHAPRNVPSHPRHVTCLQVVAKEENSAKSKIAAVVSLQVIVIVMVVMVVDELW